jgi:hypothetical protein
MFMVIALIIIAILALAVCLVPLASAEVPTPTPTNDTTALAERIVALRLNYRAEVQERMGVPKCSQARRTGGGCYVKKAR